MSVCVDLTWQHSKSEVNVREKKRKISLLVKTEDRMKKMVVINTVRKWIFFSQYIHFYDFELSRIVILELNCHQCWFCSYICDYENHFDFA